ncbi:putative blue pigment (indigoidine) exporter [Rhizobium sp. BK529]|uniref:EamA family transporter n=1 Tax=unclassified Rhizobium TaxID=2613769 RepID=UPI001052B7F2|nr:MULTISPECIES: EamA family transporter [unclassified Rhizobium]MBB3592860.1 putative blue pigment (indigoidine) exporter [Rhizobium sp. BK529]TCS07241.1 putative blue pigment (indigoidine) exporter [Rhizobium sp. BK418]
MKKNSRYVADVLTTAIAPAIWGSTYFVTTSFLPPGYPLTVAMLRALPAGLLLLLIVRKLPTGIWWGRAFILGALNFSLFWAMLFVSAYRLPGGVAATVGAVQPLIVIALSRLVLGKPIRSLAVIAGLIGMAGVGLLVLTPSAALDPVGVAAGLAGAVSMAFGTVLTRRWQPPVSSLTFTSWQLTAGGILLVPVALFLEPAFPVPTMANILGIAWLGLVGAAFTYLLWFRGLSRIEPSAAASLGFLSPVVATLLGWLALGQSLTPTQLAGFAMVLVSVWLSQHNLMPKAGVVTPIPHGASPAPAIRQV